MSLIMSVWLSIWLSFGIVSLCGDRPGCGLVRWTGAILGNASSHRPGLYPFDPLYVRVSSFFIVFSDPCTLVCTRFNKGYELELELCIISTRTSDMALAHYWWPVLVWLYTFLYMSFSFSTEHIAGMSYEIDVLFHRLSIYTESL